jgi:hypothetical protein
MNISPDTYEYSGINKNQMIPTYGSMVWTLRGGIGVFYD